jgi:hypothetical protein
MGMTWRIRVRGLVVVVAALAALAVAAGADYIDAFSWFTAW